MKAPRIDPNIFRAYDIRGIVGEGLTPEVIFLIGRAIGSAAAEQGERRVIVGRDGRLSSSALSNALIEGLRASGRNVTDLGLVSTPVLYYATHLLGSRSGVMVTGSHNPANHNGLKIVIAGTTLCDDRVQDLRRRVQARNFASGSGEVESRDILPHYIERIVGDIELARPLKLVIDCGNGVAGIVAPTLLRTLGCNLIELFCDVDGNFPNHHPDPSQPGNLSTLIDRVRRENADLGLAFDGDGDRLGVIDSAGTIIWPDRQLMLFAADVLSRQPGAEIIFDIKCTRHLARRIAELGGKPLMWRTGHSVMKAKLKEAGALLAGEMSGHIFFNERWYGFDDGVYAAARLVEILSRDCRPTEEIFAELPDSPSTPELHVPLGEGEAVAFMDRFRALAIFPGATQTDIDGVRIDFDDGFGLVRASNTTPSLMIRFEADDAASLQRIQESFRALIVQIQPDLSLPF